MIWSSDTVLKQRSKDGLCDDLKVSRRISAGQTCTRLLTTAQGLGRLISRFRQAAFSYATCAPAPEMPRLAAAR
jgi:hypothetical protein